MGEQRVFALREEFSNISFAIEDDETAEKCTSFGRVVEHGYEYPLLSIGMKVLVFIFIVE